MNAKVARIGVIGGGLGGLAAACTLAARGYSVVLFEKSPWLGGKAAVLNAAGFRFDMGPTILTMPSVLRAHLRRGRPRNSTITSTSSASTRSGAASSPTARRSTSSKTWTRWLPHSTPTHRAPTPRADIATFSPSPSACTASPTSITSGSRSAASAT